MNRIFIAVATLGSLFVGDALVAGAAPATPSVPVQSCVAPGSGPAQVAAAAAWPEACCSGRILCAQFLSTITLVHPGGSKHT